MHKNRNEDLKKIINMNTLKETNIHIPFDMNSVTM